MQAALTPDAERAVAGIAARYGLSRDAVTAMLYAVHTGGGTMAQFNIAELGGSGQWMRGGMTMVGNMFDNALKARVDALCAELATLLHSSTVFAATAAGPTGAVTSGHWWPADLGVPSATGGQNDVQYAVFPGTRRLAIQVRGSTTVYDTGDHRIGGVQQQQGGRPGTVSFTSQLGTFDVSSLSRLGADQIAATPATAPAPQVDHAVTPQPAAAAQSTAGTSGSRATEDPAVIVAALEALAGLHERGILTDEEFSSKKAELLARL